MAANPPSRVLKDRRTKNLTRRLRSGDIALIHHADLDTTAARALIDARVAGVVNAAASISGRYPNKGPEMLLLAGIPLLDRIGDEGFDAAPDGKPAILDEDCLRFENGVCLHGERLTLERAQEQMEAARANLSVELDHFARNTLDYLNREKGMLFDPIDAPSLRTRFADRHTLIVVRGEGYKEDLAMLSDYLQDARPILLAVDGGADALLLADALGARLIVAVGTHFSLEEFLDKGRSGMASTFLTRLRIGSKLVDAKGIARLWQGHHPHFREIGLILFAAATPIIGVLALSPMGQVLVNAVNVWFHTHFR